MRQVLALVAGVVVLLLLWVLFGLIGPSQDAQAHLSLPKDPKDRSSLLRSAHQLWRAKPSYYDPVRCAALIEMLVAGLEDDQWRAIASPVLFAWEQLRGDPAARESLAKLGNKPFDRAARSGSITDLETMIRIAKTHSTDRAAIQKVFDSLASEPVGSTGFSGAPLSRLLGAAVRAKEFERAKELLSLAKWGEPVRVEMETASSRTRTMLDLCLAAEAGRFEFPKIVNSWVEQDGGQVERTVFRNALESIALGVLGKYDPVKPLLSLSDFYSTSMEVSGGALYWEKVISRFLESSVLGDEAKNGAVGVLLDLHEVRVNRPGYAFDFWEMAAARSRRLHPNEPIRAVRLQERAFVAARSDAARLTAFREILSGYAKAKEYGRARAAGVERLPAIKDPVLNKEAALLLEGVQKSFTEERARAVKTEKEIEQDRRRGRLNTMREMLTHARKVGRPAGEIEAIEKSIKEIERQVTE